MIAVDWGGSSLRLYRLDAAGRILDQRRSDAGALACAGRFAEVLAAQLADWDDRLVLLCGMVGARGGWQEVPYVACPAGLDALAAGLQPIDSQTAGAALDGRQLWCAAGMVDHTGAASDVMRGEETQIAGLLARLGDGEHRICLPGTHSKWVKVSDGRIVELATAMTGELYALLRAHSILGRTMAAGEPFDGDAFDAGLARGRAPDGLAHQLFGVRTAALFERFGAQALPAYLSGLLIGHELLHALGDTRQRVHLLGGNVLLDRYAHALAGLDVPVLRHAEDLAATGLHALARARGLA